MRKKGKVVFFPALILAVVALAWIFLFHGEEPLKTERGDRSSSAGEEGVTPLKKGDAPVVLGDVEGEEKPPAAREKIASGRMVLAGRVTDLVTGEPVTKYRFSLYREAGPSGEEAKVLDEFLARGDGSFSFPVAREGRYDIEISSRDHVSRFFKGIEVRPGKCPLDLRLEVDPGGRVAGRVIESETGKPIAGALVVTDALGSIPLPHDSSTWSFPHGETDESGAFLLRGFLPVLPRVIVVAVHPEFAEGFVATKPGDEKVEIRLEKGIRIFGKVRGGDGGAGRDVCIGVSGKALPVSRLVLTDARGKYRTAPVLPGTVEVTASPWREGRKKGLPSRESGAGAPVPFAAITKRAEVVDRDVEVDFDLSGKRVSWRGTLYGPKGRPLEGGRISAFLEKSNDMGCGEAVSGVAGRFEFHGLEPGRYSLSVKIPDCPRSIPVEGVVLEGAGEFERDIHVSGGSIEGVVIRGVGGKPISGGTVTAYLESPQGEEGRPAPEDIETPVDEKGRFALLRLFPGAYSLRYENDEVFPSKTFAYCNRFGLPRNVELGKGEAVTGLRFVLYATAVVRFRGSGFSAEEASRLRLLFTREKMKKSFFNGTAYRSDGNIEFSVYIEPGLWDLEVSLGKEGSLRRKVDLSAVPVYDLVVRRDELIPEEGSVAVSGRLTRAGGDPVAGARLEFTMIDEGKSGPGGGVSQEPECLTDSSGAFSAAGFLPGRWRVRLSFDEERYALPDLVIPEKAESPFPFDPVLPAGRIAAHLFRGDTGGPLGEDDAEWDAWMVDAREGGVLISRRAGRGSALSFEGVPEGEFRLQVSARGWVRAVTSPFFAASGGFLDLGRIVLDRACPLAVEAVDEEGRPVRRIAAITAAAGTRVLAFHELLGRTGLLLDLPAGRIALRIEASGFEAWTGSVLLEDEKPRTIKAVLKRK